MNPEASGMRSVVIERDLAFPPEKLWRALTQPQLIAEWLMEGDFKPLVGHSFRFTADWGGVDCEVRQVDPNRMLSYTWEAYGLESVVTWTLTPTTTGARLRMEQSGFKPDQNQAYGGAKAGWQEFMTKLETVVSGLE